MSGKGFVPQDKVGFSAHWCKGCWDEGCAVAPYDAGSCRWRSDRLDVFRPSPTPPSPFSSPSPYLSSRLPPIQNYGASAR
jgi:hypothetical protein